MPTWLKVVGNGKTGQCRQNGRWGFPTGGGALDVGLAIVSNLMRWVVGLEGEAKNEVVWIDRGLWRACYHLPDYLRQV